MADVVLPTPSGHLFDGKSVEELEKLLDNLTPDGDIPREPEPPAPEPEIPSVEVEKAPEPEKEAPVEPEPPEDQGVDARASEIEGEKIKREKLEAALALQQAHSSRLAGEIGFLREQLKSPPAAREPYEPQTQQETDRLAQLEQRFARSESERRQMLVDQASQAILTAMDTTALDPIREQIAVVAPKYREQMAEVRKVSDPDLARQLTEAIGRTVIAEAKELAWETKHKSLVEKAATTSQEAIKAKKAATISASGTAPTPQPKPKTFQDMTTKELDDWLRANVQ